MNILRSLMTICLVLLFYSMNAKSLLQISIPVKQIHLNPASSSIITFSVKNVSGKDLPGITVPKKEIRTPVFFAKLESTTCAGKLLNNRHCEIKFGVSGANAGIAALSPEVCIADGYVCVHGSVRITVNEVRQSIPIASLARILPNNVQVGVAYPIVINFLNTDNYYPITGLRLAKNLPNSVETANTCKTILAPLASCQVSYLFTPPLNGSYHLMETFRYNEGDPITLSKTVLATKAAISGKVVSPLPSNIEKDSHYNVIFQYTNFGTAPVTYTAVKEPPELSRVVNTCTGGTLLSHSSCTVSGQYMAKTTGEKKLEVTLFPSGPGTIEPVKLTTNAIATDVVVVGKIEPALPESVTPGKIYSVVFTFTNNNQKLKAENFKINKVLPYFTQISDTCSNITDLAPGGSCVISGNFQTDSEGPVALTVLFKHDGNASASLTTSSIAKKAAVVGTVNGFPANVEKDIPQKIVFTFSNHGSANAVIPSDGTILSFPNIQGTAIDNCKGITLEPGKSCTIKGTFKAVSIGAVAWNVSLSYAGGREGKITETSINTSTNVGDTVITGVNSSSPIPTEVEFNSKHDFRFVFTNSAFSPSAATDINVVLSTPHVTSLNNSCKDVTTLAPGGSCLVSGTFSSTSDGPFTISATLSYKQGSPVTVQASTYVLPALATVYKNQLMAMQGAEPLQWISANFPNGFRSLPKVYPTTVSAVKDVNITNNTYSIDLNNHDALQIIKDGIIGNAFHFIGNQSLYTTSSTISTNFTIVALMRKPTINIGRLLTGYINSKSNSLMGYWNGKQDAWWINNGGNVIKEGEPQTTDAKLYIFSNDKGEKTMYKYPKEGTFEKGVQSSTPIGGNEWGTVVYGRPLAQAHEAAKNAYLYEVMVFNRVLTPAQRQEIVRFYQSVYHYWEII